MLKRNEIKNIFTRKEIKYISFQNLIEEIKINTIKNKIYKLLKLMEKKKKI